MKMFYPLKFTPVYKKYIWGGRNLEKMNKKLPCGIVAESWEVSCHSAGESVISNGIFKGRTFNCYINEFNYKAMGTDIQWKIGDRFPLLIKLIDANKKLSVQVHPDDLYAAMKEKDKHGKNEMWYVISAKPRAKVVYGLKAGTTREIFLNSIKNNSIEEHLNYIEVFDGDVLDIPAGLVHAIGDGILLAEVQQNSNNTYRIYDYNRVDESGNKRHLHIDKAMDVINFSETFNLGCDIININKNLKISKLKNSCVPLVHNEHFSVDFINISGEIETVASGGRFYIYIIVKGEGTISYNLEQDISSNNVEDLSSKINVKTGDSIFIPALLGKYKITGNIKAIKAYIP